MEKKTKVVNGMTFDESTPQRVCEILSNNCNQDYTVRVFYGDMETGRDWCEAFDTVGYIRRSCGPVKVPLLIARKNLMGGHVILDNCIVRIQIGREVKWQHENYHCPIEQRGCSIYDTEKNMVIFNAKTEDKAKRELDFFMGRRNNH